MITKKSKLTESKMVKIYKSMLTYICLVRAHKELILNYITSLKQINCIGNLELLDLLYCHI